MRYFKLVNNKAELCEGIAEYLKQDKSKWSLANDKPIEGIIVHTVFQGIDSSWGDNNDFLCFMVSVLKGDDTNSYEFFHYRTYEEAMEAHKTICETFKNKK